MKPALSEADIMADAISKYMTRQYKRKTGVKFTSAVPHTLTRAEQIVAALELQVDQMITGEYQP